MAIRRTGLIRLSPVCSARVCSGRSVEAGLAHAGDALLLVEPLVVADLPEQVGDGVEFGVVGGEVTVERLGFPFGMLGATCSHDWYGTRAMSSRTLNFDSVRG